MLRLSFMRYSVSLHKLSSTDKFDCTYVSLASTYLLALSLFVSLALHIEQVDITNNPHFGNHSLGGVGVLCTLWWTHVPRG